MKRILLIIIALLPALHFLAQNPSSEAYPNGIYIFCGKEIPRSFHYLVEKKSATGEWENLAELRAPKNAAALTANLLNLPAYFRSMMPLPIEQSEHLWTRLSKSLSTDSLYGFATDPKMLAAVGCGWFDDGISTSGTCQYRVSKVIQNDVIVLGEVSQLFPQNNYQGALATLQFMPANDVITIYYGLSDTVATYSLKLYRSRLQENDFYEVPAHTSYSSLDGRTVAVVRDETVTKGVAYSYVAIPYDALGNLGYLSDTINIYNLTTVAEIGFTQALNAVADKEKGGVQLTWKIASDFYVMSYELYRSKDYDGGYDCIAILPRGTTGYFDSDIDPAEAHYYFITVNNGYASSMPSVRVPVILEGDQSNFLPPQNLDATLSGNVVRLTFNSIEPDTRSYQIYRGEGYTGELTLIASLASTDSVVVFADTLDLSVNPRTFSYAVADVNSSYAISPLSERVSIQYGGGMLPIPTIIEAQLRGNEIFVVWNDLSQTNPSVSGYKLYRSTVDSEGKTVEEPRIVATLPYNTNVYIDTLFVPGSHYRYAVESFDFNGETSNLSLHAGVTVPRQLPLPPGQVSAMASNNRILLRWDNPLDPSVQSIRIYRAMLNVKASLLKELPAGQSTFADQTAKKGEQYFYYVVTVNQRGEESKADEPVSARIRK